jgi:hypothetical protein
VLALLWGLAEANEITNGEFDTDLSGWTTSGDVTQDAGTAVLGDDGAFNLAAGASVEPSPKGGDWLHFSHLFESTYDYLASAFQLSDFNFLDADSTVGIDNASLTRQQAPTPTSLTLATLGPLLLWRGKWGPWRPGYRP